ncbi:glycosyltransferase [Gloeobacter kilaueensis]|uniref:Glycosyl transferase family 28 C-terminal domain-containing protein n=1 Tax=Gloeobacter kilaueensis (strain ATCC BAA-2537 / CCAP 1431/1 / ULC 316 / JS1) TaxID=1183438 RepID=U5QMK6_GLOK1|nr:glycosyltransferase [Gloeobacter kilaueensis]AGY60237.1 hypothetical protein GKIL_3991 [Gloeobacter kilaueensis JS1]
MIFVTVGTEQFPFNRLLHWVARAIERGDIREEVIVQSGACTDRVPGAQTFSLLSQPEFDRCVQQARLVISHCGEGSFLQLSTANRPFVLVPRRCGLGEHLDDHQWELARVLDRVGVPVAWIPNDIGRFVNRPVPVATAALSSQSLLRCLTEHFAQQTPSRGATNR